MAADELLSLAAEGRTSAATGASILLK